MKIFITLFAVLCFISSSSAQTKKSTAQFVKHDTLLLRADECKWIIKPLAATATGESVPQLLLTAIEKGTIKAVDVQTNQPIPAKEIFTWRIETVTEQVVDSTGNIVQTNILQPLRTADHVIGIKIYQDWYFDGTTKKFHSVIQWIELVEEARNAGGDLIGDKSFCRIYY
ncbi:hypothetical protein [Lacibacter sp. H407]|uniref:hypothetical protein n=1 Tax=Lacibacter sp. H407 TaxID=3133423 RepID=UPI0030C2DA06